MTIQPHPHVVHLGDFHAAPGPRNAVRYRALDRVLAEGLALPTLGAWLWPGDLDHLRMGIEDKNALAQRVQVMAHRAPVVICYGNHDLPGDLDFLARLASTFPIYVIDTPQTIRVPLATGQFASIFVLPYPTKAGLAALGVSPAQMVDQASVALDAIFAQAALDLEAARQGGDLTLMIGHVNVSGAMVSTGQPNIGREIELSTSMLDRLGPIYKGLNHIHVAQQVGGAYYPGSICRLDWGEIEEKSYLGIDFDEHGSYHVTRKPIDVAPMYHVDGLLTRDEFTYQVTAGPGGALQEKPASWKGCEVRVRYRFKQSEKSILNEALVLAEFAEALRFEREPIAVPDRSLRAPEVAAARTLAEKAAAWCTVSGETATEGTLAKLARLEHGDPVQLLDDVAHALAEIEHGEQRATVAA